MDRFLLFPLRKYSEKQKYTIKRDFFTIKNRLEMKRKKRVFLKNHAFFVGFFQKLIEVDWQMK